MTPTITPVENMQLFRTNPVAFLEASHIAGTPIYGSGAPHEVS